mgnify:CR=1 FL=1
MEDSSHHIWMGTWDKGLWKLDPQTKQVEKYLTDGKGILHIHSILEYSPELLLLVQMMDLRYLIQSLTKAFSIIITEKMKNHYPTNLSIRC